MVPRCTLCLLVLFIGSCATDRRGRRDAPPVAALPGTDDAAHPVPVSPADAPSAQTAWPAVLPPPATTPTEVHPDRRVHAYVDGVPYVMDLDQARRQGFTILDLSDDWVPYIFWSETPGKNDYRPNAYLRTYVELANDRIDVDGGELPHGSRNFLEVYGIPPSLGILRNRVIVDQSKACFQTLNRNLFHEYYGPVTARDAGSSAALRRAYQNARQAYLDALRKARVKTVDALSAIEAYRDIAEDYRRLRWRYQVLYEVPKRLICEGLLSQARSAPGVFDWTVNNALRQFERKHHIYGRGTVNAATTEALARTPTQGHYETLRRVLAERVASAAGILEDGSVVATYRGLDGRQRPVPNLVDTFTEITLAQLGLTDVAQGIAFLTKRGEGGFARFLVGVRLPPLPEYYSAHMDLHAELDRGDVWYDLPFDEEGNVVHRGRRRLPTLTLYVRYANQNIPLIRWRTTIGGWNSELLNNEEYYKYKMSDVGPRLWRNIVAGPVWIPPAATPAQDIVKVVSRGGRAERVVNSSVIGPGYASAFGLVAAFHISETGHDNQIRTHGSVNYMSVQGGYSHGCHRLYNNLAVRLYSFILAHREFRRRGQTRLEYTHRFEHRGEEFQLNIDTRGYYYTLTPPVPIDVLEGTIRGRQKEPIEEYVKKPTKVYKDDLPEVETRDTHKTAPRIRPKSKNILSDPQML